MNPKAAYTALLETKESGRPETGWYIGLAVENEPGYRRLSPGFGPYKDAEAAKEHAREMNTGLGLTDIEAYGIVASSMSAQAKSLVGKAAAVRRRMKSV